MRVRGVLEYLPMSTPRAFIPRSRHHGVVSEEVDGETLLYVEATHQASSLNGPASRIWALCDGKRPVEAIAAETSLDPDEVVTALRKLADAGLLQNGADLPPAVNLWRRRILISVGLALPVIFVVTAPGAAAAASCAPKGPCNLAQTCCDTGERCPALGRRCP
jgi:hypothetical protein